MEINAVLEANRNLRIQANEAEDLRYKLHLEIQKCLQLKLQLENMQIRKLKIARIFKTDKDGCMCQLRIVSIYESEAGQIIEVR